MKTGRHRGRIWKRALLCLASAYAGLALVALLFADHFIFVPPPAGYDTSSERLILIPAGQDRTVAAFWYPPRGPEDPVLLWAHGNAEDIGYLSRLHRELAAEGFGILAYDYPGYGLSDGSPAEDSCYAAQQAAFTHLVDSLGTEPSRLFLVGQSVGSGPACWLAEREETAGLVLISPFLSAFRTLTPVPLFPGDRFPNRERITSITEPLLVIHGTADRIVPFAHGEQLHTRHPGPKELVPVDKAGHNDIWSAGYPDIVAALRRFTGR